MIEKDTKESLERLRPKTQADLGEISLAYRAAPFAKAFEGRLPTAVELKNITEELGVELASAIFMKTAADSHHHGPFARLVRSVEIESFHQYKSLASQTEVAFITSNLYQSGRKWGDHVEEWRTWARQLGCTTEVFETNPRSSVAVNARLLLEQIQAKPHPNRIVVSYSQGTSEFRYLLQRRTGSDELRGLRGWMNVAGSFAGAGSSHYLTSGLRKYTSQIDVRLAGRTPFALAETSSQFGIWRKPFMQPPDMMTTSLIGVPLRLQLPRGLHAYYNILAKTTPNDGVVGVLEAAAHPGFVIPIAGMSHRAESLLLQPVFKRVLAVLVQKIFS